MSKLVIAKDVFAFLMVGVLLIFISEETKVVDNTTALNNCDIISTPKANLAKQIRSTIFNQQPIANCFEVNFPIQIIYPNGHTKKVTNNNALDNVVENWFKNNPNSNNEPTFSYPFDITMKNGRQVAIENETQFLTIADVCDELMLAANYNTVNNFCFDFIYPMQLVTPNGTLQQVQNDDQVDQAIRTWIAQNPNTMEELSIKFPVDIKFEDGVMITLEEVNALSAAIQFCENDSLEHDSSGEEPGIDADLEKEIISTPYIGA